MSGGDFDAAYAEATGFALLPVRAFGEDFEVPSEMPALFELLLARSAMRRVEGGDDLEAAEADLAAAYDALVGAGRVARWRENGASYEKLGAFIRHVRGMQEEHRGRLADRGEAGPPVPGGSRPGS